MAQLITANNIDPAALNVISGPKVTGIQYPGDDTAASIAGGQTVTLTGAGFQTGATVYVDSVVVGITSVISSTTISFVTPAKASGHYTLYVVNPDGGTATFLAGIQYSGVPTWSTGSGSLGTVYETDPINYTLSATSDSTVSYTVTGGTLAAGAELNASTGTITGNANLVASSTTYNFTVDAIDQEQQNTSRNFSITVNPDVVTFNSPADGTTYSNLTGDVFSLTLNATSIMGKTISYSANVLPDGLTLSGANITGTFSVVANTASLITATAATTLKTATRLLNWAITAPPPVINASWYAAGLNTSGVLLSSIERLTFATDTSTLSIRGPLSVARDNIGGTNTITYGWYASGRGVPSPTPPYRVHYSTVDRVTFQADSVTASVRGPLSAARSYVAAVGNNSYGWFGGGWVSPNLFNLIDRIDYSNDGVTALARTTLPVSASFVEASGNQDYGWFGGGSPLTSRVDRMTYSTDTAALTLRGSLTASRYHSCSSGNSTQGLWVAGLTPAATSSIDRMYYATDTVYALRGPLALPRTSHTGSGSEDYSWFGGGYTYSPGVARSSSIERITYANDTTASLRTVMSTNRAFPTAVSGAQ